MDVIGNDKALTVVVKASDTILSYFPYQIELSEHDALFLLILGLPPFSAPKKTASPVFQRLAVL